MRNAFFAVMWVWLVFLTVRHFLIGDPDARDPRQDFDAQLATLSGMSKCHFLYGDLLRFWGKTGSM